MKFSQLFKGLSWLIGLNLLIKPIWIFGIDRQVQNLVGYENFGEYFALFNLTFLLSFLADAGLTNMANRNLAAGENIPFKKLFNLKLALAIFYAGVVLFIGWLTNIRQWNLLLLLILIQVLTSFFVFFRNIITAHQLFVTDAWLSVIDKFLMIIVCGSFLYTPALTSSFHLELFLQIHAGSIFFATLISFFIILNKIKFEVYFALSASNIFRLILPFTVIILLMGIHARLDGFLLERLHINGAYEAGVYASAFRLLDAGNMIGYLAASFLVPFIARNRLQKDLVQETVLTIRHSLILSAIFITSFVVFFPGWLQNLLYYTSIPYHSLILQLTISVLPAYFFLHVYGSVLSSTGNLKVFAFILLFSVFINSIINFIFIPLYGAEACCVAAIISQYLCAFFCFLIASKRLKINLHLKSFLIYLLLLILLIFLFYIGEAEGLNKVIIFFGGGLLTSFAMFVQIKFKKSLISIS